MIHAPSIAKIYNKTLNYIKNNKNTSKDDKLNDTLDRINTKSNVKSINEDKFYSTVTNDIHSQNWNEFNNMINIEHKVTNIENHFKVLNKL
jgi:hypothetical protein